jgi:O-antigen ligase
VPLSAAPADARARWVALAGPAVVALVALARVPWRDPAGGQAHWVLPGELALCVGALALALGAAWAGLSVPRDRVGAALRVGVALGAASALTAPNPWLGLRSLSLVIAGGVVFEVARATRAAVGEPLPSWPLLIVVAWSAATVIAEALGVWPGLSRTGHRPGGWLGERNLAAEWLVCALPVVVAEAWRLGPARGAAAWVGGAAVVAIVLTRTRSAWLAGLALAGVGLVAWGRASPGVDRRRGLTLAAVGVAAIVLAVQLPIRLPWASDAPYASTARRLLDATEGSGAGRVAQAGVGLAMVARHPWLGVGLGNWSGQYLAYASAGDPTVSGGPWPVNRLPNSDVVGLWAEGGTPIAALAGLTVASLLRGRGGEAGVRRATLAALAVVGSLDAVLQVPAPLAWVAWVVGGSTPAERQTAPNRAATLALIGCLVALVALSAGRLAAFSLAVHPRHVDELAWASALDPGDARLRERLAEAWTDLSRCDLARPVLDALTPMRAPSPYVAALQARCAAPR